MSATSAAVEIFADELVDFRRDLHRHPELSWSEARTTRLIADRLTAAGVRVSLLDRSGLVAEVGPSRGPSVALRADLDALPVDDLTKDPWRSETDGIAHACGHDVHATALLGAGLALAKVAPRLTRRVRLIFQPAEEVMPGGALNCLDEGVLDDVVSIFGLHCDPGLDVGSVGLREGPLTGAADAVEIKLLGRGGHTSRPHLTQDLTYALGKVLTELPSVLSRRLDPRSGVSVVWGSVHAGSAGNVIPASGSIKGTIRMLDAVAWAEAERIVRVMVDHIVAPYGVKYEVDYTRGVPPVVNDHVATALLARTVEAEFGEEAHLPTPQSLGGEDFAWYVEKVPGAMARLGTRTPGGPTYDLHQGDLRIDEGAVSVGARLLAGVAVRAIQALDASDTA